MCALETLDCISATATDVRIKLSVVVYAWFSTIYVRFIKSYETTQNLPTDFTLHRNLSTCRIVNILCILHRLHAVHVLVFIYLYFKDLSITVICTSWQKNNICTNLCFGCTVLVFYCPCSGIMSKVTVASLLRVHVVQWQILKLII